MYRAEKKSWQILLVGDRKSFGRNRKRGFGNPLFRQEAESNRKVTERVISAEIAFFGRKCLLSAKSDFFRPKISAERVLFRPKLGISAGITLPAGREILPECSGYNRNRKFRPKTERTLLRSPTRCHFHHNFLSRAGGI